MNMVLSIPNQTWNVTGQVSGQSISLKYKEGKEISFQEFDLSKQESIYSSIQELANWIYGKNKSRNSEFPADVVYEFCEKCVKSAA